MDQATIRQLLAEIKRTKQKIAMYRDERERWLKELHRRHQEIPLRDTYQEEIRNQEARLSSLIFELPDD